MNRIRFWLSRKPFKITKDMEGFAPVRYYPLNDKLLVRTSLRGYVTGHCLMTRAEFLAIPSTRGPGRAK